VIPTRGTHTRYSHADPTCRPHTRCPHAVPTCGTHMRCPHAVPTCGTHMRYPHADPTHDPDMQSRHAVPTRGPHTRYPHAVPTEKRLTLSLKMCAKSPGSLEFSSRRTSHSWGEFHDQADAKWIVFRGLLRGHYMIRPLGGQPPTGLSAARGLAALGACLVVLVTIN
jgi:hypothetical protein